MTRSATSLLRVVAVLLMAGVVWTHALPTMHHTGAAHLVAVDGADVLVVPAGEHQAAASAHAEDGCDRQCQTRSGVVMLCIAVLGAALAFLSHLARRGQALSRWVSPPPSLPTYPSPALPRAPDLVAGLCISRT